MVIERLNSERLVLLGWTRAILLQIAHPLIAAGVIEHSAFRGGALQAAVRLHHTVSAMLSLTFGDPARRDEAIAQICAIHRRVNGTLSAAAGPFPAGTRYSAEDPALLLWVHATLLDSSADIYQRLVAPLTMAERDRMCEEAAPLLHALGGDPAATPLTWAALQQYMDGIYASGVLAVSNDSRTLAHAVLSPRAAGVPVPLGGVHRLIAIGLLPPSIRDAYGFRWSAVRQRRFERTLAVVRRLRAAAPPQLAHWSIARSHPVATTSTFGRLGRGA